MLAAVVAAAALAGAAAQLFLDRRRNTQQPDTHEQQPRKWRRIAAAVLVIGVGTTAAVVIQRGPHRGRRRRLKFKGGSDGRIPLKDLVRFKERQWFLEEVENSRDGDPNSMLRLSKMYLHGQGCQRSIGMAQQWLGRAKYHGVHGTLDELFATDDPQPRQRLRRLAADEEERRAALRLAGGHMPASPQVSR